MKSILLSVIFLFISSFNAFSQLTDNFNYSIGVYGFSIMEMPKVFNQNTQQRLNSFVRGGMVKFNDNQISFRVGATYLKQSVKFDDDCINCNLASGKVTDKAYKLGFEKNLSYSMLQPYFGGDLGYRSNLFKGMMSVVNNQKSVTTTNSIEATKSGFTVMPFIGLKFTPVSMITIFAESSLEFYYSYERRESVSQDAQALYTFNKTYQTEYLLNPVSIGIQIHLGAN